jgi:hypothetical protein
VRRLQVDWNGLHSAFQMNMPEVKCFFSLEDGTVLKLPPGDQNLPTIQGQRDLYRPIEAVPSRIQYQWLDSYIKTVEDETLRERLQAAINGKGAFRRFKDILLTLPDERRRWFEFRDVAMRQRIIEWVREQGVDAQNAPNWIVTPIEDPPVPNNRPRDLEALRDFMIEWVDTWAMRKEISSPLPPLALEELANAVGQTFRVKPLKQDL